MTGWQDRFQTAFSNRVDWHGGTADAFALKVERIGLLQGGTLELQPVGVTAIVGSNNVGKSTLLREVHERLTHHPGNPWGESKIVTQLVFQKEGTLADAIAWVGDNSTLVVDPSNTSFRRAGAHVNPHNINAMWGDPREGMGPFANFFSFYGNAQGRFGIGGSAEMRDSISDPPTHPVHELQDSRSTFEELARVAKEVFGVELTLDTLARQVRIRVGKLAAEPPRIDDIPDEYRRALAQLPSLDEQGDGMRSLMGQLLPILGAPYKLVILDEPEAFLHPPQAHALGRELGRLATANQVQILVATHDRNLLTGLLESDVDVSVVRLTREGNHASAHQLDAQQLRGLWSDPVLRHTNILEGLFHKAVVLLEAEVDCAYMAAALSEIVSDGQVASNEILFVPTGGKAGMHKVATALGAVRVPTVAAPDLDVISDEQLLRVLVESLGSTWSERLSDLWRRATSGIRAPREAARIGHVLDAINAIFAGRREEAISKEVRDELYAQMRSNGSPWEPIKTSGVAALTGDARVALEELLAELADRHVVPVREGELERLAPEVAVRKGSGWLSAALAAGSHRNAPTRSHIERIVAATQS